MTTESVAEKRSHPRIFHGMSKHPLYKRWKSMINRCYSPSASHFSVYGGRGIRVAVRWMDFRNFVADMAASYAAGLTLDRIDPNGHYTSDNCRWADTETQSENRRSIRFVEIAGQRVTLTKAARSGGLHPETVALRIRKGEPATLATTRKATTNPAKRPVAIAGQEFPSLTAAAKALGVTKNAIHGKLRRGKATYLDEVEQ